MATHNGGLKTAQTRIRGIRRKQMVVKTPGSGGLVLDASAILHSNLDFSGGGYLMPGSILNEIHDETARIAVNSAIIAGKIRIKNPQKSFVRGVMEKAEETGDLENLSDEDIDVIALAIENNSSIITDDYSIQNVAKELGLKFEAIAQRGIKKRILWRKVCEGCGREYPMNLKICDVCGSMLKKVAKPAE